MRTPYQTKNLREEVDSSKVESFFQQQGIEVPPALVKRFAGAMTLWQRKDPIITAEIIDQLNKALQYVINEYGQLPTTPSATYMREWVTYLFQHQYNDKLLLKSTVFGDNVSTTALNGPYFLLKSLWYSSSVWAQALYSSSPQKAILKKLISQFEKLKYQQVVEKAALMSQLEQQVIFPMLNKPFSVEMNTKGGLSYTLSDVAKKHPPISYKIQAVGKPTEVTSVGLQNPITMTAVPKYKITIQYKP